MDKYETRKGGKGISCHWKKNKQKNKTGITFGQRFLSQFLDSQQSPELCFDFLTSAQPAHLFSFSAWSDYFTILHPSRRPDPRQESQGTILTASGVTRHGARSQMAVQTSKYALSAIAAAAVAVQDARTELQGSEMLRIPD